MDAHAKTTIDNAVDVPSRYTYEKNLKCQSYKLVALVGRILFGVKNAELPKATAELHASSLMRADTLADNVVNDLYKPDGGGAKLFKKVMEQGLDIDDNVPESMQIFYKQITTQPEWLDLERLDRGIKTSHRLGRIGMYGMAMLGLLAGYSNPDLGKPLIATGALTGDSTFKRINFTSAFWMEVTESVEALQLGGKGFDTAVNVRIKHGLARRHILSKEDWQLNDWGVPINTSDSAITNVGFSSMLVLSSKLLGFRITNKEFEDILHLWRYLGYLLGDDDRLLPKTTEDAIQALGFVAAGNDNIPDADSITLANALINSFKQKGRGSLLEFTGFFKNFFYRAYAQYLIPPPQHRGLKLPTSYGLMVLVALQAVVIAAVDNTRHYTKIFTPIFQKIGRRGQHIFIRNRYRIADAKYEALSSNESIAKP